MESDWSSLRPYPVFRRNDEFRFFAANGAEYAVYFSEADGYFPDVPFVEHVQVFGFYPRPTTVHNDPTDRRIAETVVWLLGQFLKDPRKIALYVCDQSDGRQRNRNRLFEAWFQRYNRDCVKIDVSFEGGTFISAISSETNPHLADFQKAFFSYGQEYK